MIFGTGSRSADDISALRDLVSTLCPGYSFHDVLHRSSTSVLLRGTVWGDPVVAKVLVSDSPFWRQTFVREIDNYRLFVRTRPPFRVPGLVAADDRGHVLVIEYIDDKPVSGERRPTDRVPSEQLAATFTALRRVNSWPAPADELTRVLDYSSRFDRYRRDGQLGADEHQALSETVLELGDAVQFCHGNLDLRHVLRHQEEYREGEYTLIDWSFAGMFLPGFDLARLWTLLRATYGVRSEIQDTVRAMGDHAWDAFVVNAAICVAQELRTHRDFEREQDWATIRAWLRL